MQMKRKTRGTAMLLVLILSSAVGIIAFAGVGLSGAVSNTASRAENAQQDDWAVVGASELAKSDLMMKRIAIGGSKAYTIAGRTLTVQMDDNTSSMPNT